MKKLRVFLSTIILFVFIINSLVAGKVYAAEEKNNTSNDYISRYKCDIQDTNEIAAYKSILLNEQYLINNTDYKGDKKLKYLLLDINNDGIKEMLLSDTDYACLAEAKLYLVTYSNSNLRLEKIEDSHPGQFGYNSKNRNIVVEHGKGGGIFRDVYKYEKNKLTKVVTLFDNKDSFSLEELNPNIIYKVNNTNTDKESYEKEYEKYIDGTDYNLEFKYITEENINKDFTVDNNKNTNMQNDDIKKEDDLWRDNSILECNMELSDTDKTYLFMALGELDYIRDNVPAAFENEKGYEFSKSDFKYGIPSNDKLKLYLLYNFIYEHEKIYYNFGSNGSTKEISLDDANEFLQSTVNVKIDDYSPYVNLLNTLNRSKNDSDTIIFSGSNRGDDQPVVKITSIQKNDDNTVNILGCIAHVTALKAERIDNFSATAKINTNTKYGLLQITSFYLNGETEETFMVKPVDSKVSKCDNSEFQETSNESVFKCGDNIVIYASLVFVISVIAVIVVSRKLKEK